MKAIRLRSLPEWPVHLLIWALLLLRNVVGADDPAAAGLPEATPTTIWLLETGYLLVKATAFYLAGWLVARPLLAAARSWQPFARAALGLLLTLLLITGMRYGLEFQVFKPLFGFDNYERNTTFTALWFVENSARYYFDVVLYGLLYTVIRYNLQAERRRRETEQAHTTAELTFLRSQLNPHFLFNTINDIYALVYQKSDAAPGALLKLSELLRYMLHEAHHDHVLLSRELDYLTGLIELQRIGTKGNLHLDYQLHGRLNGQLIAPMLLVSFVENAFKHGVLSEAAQPVTLRLAVSETTLDFCLRNTKNQQQKDQVGGIGLANVRRRLALLYPARHVLHVAETPTDFQITLHLDL